MTGVPMLSALTPMLPGTRRTIDETIAVINEDVAIRPRQGKISTGDTSIAAPLTSMADLAIPIENWTWETLRDYVIRKIEETVGIVPRQPPYKEQAIFSGFLTRHGDRAAQIARYAFETAGGYWKNAPVSVNRFCANSDPYFADVIKRHLIEVEQAAAARL